MTLAEKVFITTFIATALALVSCNTNADSYSVSVGVWTDHLGEPKGDLNEDNELILFTGYSDWNKCDCAKSRDLWTVGRFVNSHYAETQVIGAGREYHLTGEAYGGVMITAIYGYEGYLDTHWKGVIFAPVSYFRYEMVRVTSLAHVINVSLEFEF